MLLIKIIHLSIFLLKTKNILKLVIGKGLLLLSNTSKAI